MPAGECLDKLYNAGFLIVGLFNQEGVVGNILSIQISGKSATILRLRSNSLG